MTREEIIKILQDNTEITLGLCFLWRGSLDGDGYGMIFLNDFNPKRLGVHRLSAFLYLELDLDSKLLACHKCKNKNCWNPEHLYVGTYSDNANDITERKDYISHNTVKTHCPQGHEYSEENTYIYKGRRNCKTCQRQRDKNRRIKFKEN